jgi:Ca2+-binding EF-hand superfamily protein
MQISSSSSSYDTSSTQKILQALLQQKANSTGQDLPGAAAADGASPAPPGPPPGGASTQFDAKTLTSLLSTQEKGSASSAADKLVSDLDTDGDGSLSLAEIQAGLQQSGDTSTLASGVAKLDTDGDGKLSSSELASALQGAHKGHHAHHHAPPADVDDPDDPDAATATQGGRPSAADLSAKMISALDTDGDGSLSLDEIEAALQNDGSDASKGSNTLGSAVAKLDTDGDGKLGAAELTSALQAFRDAHERGQKAGTTENSIAA